MLRAHKQLVEIAEGLFSARQNTSQPQGLLHPHFREIYNKNEEKNFVQVKICTNQWKMKNIYNHCYKKRPFPLCSAMVRWNLLPQRPVFMMSPLTTTFLGSRHSALSQLL